MNSTGMNYFQLFNLPESFDVDLQQLSARYRDLQRTVHPDRFATASERDRLLALHKAAEINDALATLKSPLRRAEYLLTLRDVHLASEQQTFRDPQFLMQQMELREQLAEIESADDAEAALDAFLATLTDDIRAQQHYIGQQLGQQDGDADHRAADAVRKLKFLLKLQTEAERLEERLLSV